MNIFQEELLDHYKFPHNRKILEKESFSADDHNPSCGDRLAVQGLIQDTRIVDIGFQGKGCILSQATMSMLTEKYIGSQVEEVLALSSENILQLVGMPLGPTRLKCALLGLHVLQQGIESFQNVAHDSSYS